MSESPEQRHAERPDHAVEGGAADPNQPNDSQGQSPLDNPVDNPGDNPGAGPGDAARPGAPRAGAPTDIDRAQPDPTPEPAPTRHVAPPPGEPVTRTPAAGLDQAIDAETAAEIEAAMNDLGEAGAADPSPKSKGIRGPRVVQGGREHRTGTVVSVGASDVFVEFGPKEIGVVEVTQWKDGPGGGPGGGKELPKVGDPLEVVVQRFDATESIYMCVLPGAVQKAAWEMLEAGQTVEARVTGTNKGGLELEVAGHRAFMPASQVDVQRVPDLSVFVGEKMACDVQKIDRRGGGNIVLSRRDVLDRERAKAAESLREALKEGEEVDGTVRKIMDFGAFVDLGGVDGLVHLNDLSHDRVNHGAKNVARHVSEGQKVRVQILKLDWEQNRISLGLKQLAADPFSAAADEVVEGAELSGKVTKLADFGAFVEVAPGVEGLVHISELDWKRVGQVSDVLQEGEVVQVKVLKVDPGDRKVSLSIKQLKDRPEQPRGRGGGRGGGRGEQPVQKEETPEMRRLREKAKHQGKGGSSSGGLGDAGGMGMGLGDLKL